MTTPNAFAIYVYVPRARRSGPTGQEANTFDALVGPLSQLQSNAPSGVVYFIARTTIGVRR